MLRFHSNQNAFVLSVVGIVDPDLPGAGNVNVRVSVTCGGFTGRVEVAVPELAWKEFNAGVGRVEKGEANQSALVSIPPSGLAVIVSRPEHGAIVLLEGTLQSALPDSDARGELRFSFTVDAKQLSPAVEALTCMSWH